MRKLSRSLEDKKLLWFEKTNKYVWMEEPAFVVFELFQNNVSKKSIEEKIIAKYNLPEKQAHDFVSETIQLISQNTKIPKVNPDQKIQNTDIKPNGHPWSVKHYQFKGVNFQFQYFHQRLEEMFHPKLAHLEAEDKKEDVHTFILFRFEDNLYLQTDSKLIGPWGMDEVHFFQGKVSAEFLNKVYNKEENDWMAVFHASALGDGKHSIIMPGESGSGKSTSLAILMANGFNILADDFVPVEADNCEALLYPAAISIKEGAWDLIEKTYPGFGDSGEVWFKNADTKMIYLPPTIPEYPERTSAAVKAIVFIKYSAGAKLELAPVSKHIAFQRLVTDSWISPIYENVDRFMDWFIELPCYQLTYSNNEQMVETIRKIFNDEF